MARSILLLASALTAQDRFEAAEVAYDVGQFERAKKLYTEAYELDPRPGLLFNIGQCHKKLGDWSRAAFFYRRYLAKAPEGEGAERLRELIAEMDAKAAAQPRRAVLTVADPPPPPPPLTVTEASPEEPLYKQWWLWTAAGAATTLTIVAAVAVGSRPRARSPSRATAGRAAATGDVLCREAWAQPP